MKIRLFQTYLKIQYTTISYTKSTKSNKPPQRIQSALEIFHLDFIIPILLMMPVTSSSLSVLITKIT